MAIILILEDEEIWLARHNLRLTQAGFKCRYTALAKEAIELAKDPEIRITLIDEILYVPPVPNDELKRELQRWSGSDVIHEINKFRSDMQFILVTSAPRLRSQGNLDTLTHETARLRRLKGVIDVIHKHSIDIDPDYEYGWLIKLLKDSQKSPSDGQITTPRVLVGLGVPDVMLQTFRDQYKQKHHKEYRSNRVFLNQFFREIGVDEVRLGKSVRDFLVKLEKGNQAIEKKIFIEMAGSKQLAPTDIKSHTSAFQILMQLALHAECGEELVFREQDYDYKPRKTNFDGAINPDLDSRVIEDFSFAYDEGGRKRLHEGVQIEKILPKRSPLKTEISRLRNKLATLNIAPARQVFPEGNDGIYRPAFETGIFLYKAENKKQIKKQISN
jgi:hypothetical protein